MLEVAEPAPDWEAAATTPLADASAAEEDLVPARLDDAVDWVLAHDEEVA